MWVAVASLGSLAWLIPQIIFSPRSVLTWALPPLIVTMGSLQKVVRDRWGQKAELAVARAIVADTLEDDLAADEKIDGEHATVTLKEETHLPPLLLVKDNEAVVDYLKLKYDQINAGQ